MSQNVPWSDRDAMSMSEQNVFIIREWSSVNPVNTWIQIRVLEDFKFGVFQPVVEGVKLASAISGVICRGMPCKPKGLLDTLSAPPG